MGRYCFYCPQMMDWNGVPLPTLEPYKGYQDVYLEEIYQWCEDNTRGRWTYQARTWWRNEGNPRFPHHYNTRRPLFLFKDPKDAILFKLAYG